MPPIAKKTRRRGRGEGSIYKRPDGTWAGQISLGVNGNGKRKRRDVYGKTKADVATKLDELRSQSRTGGLPDATSLTVEQLLDRWLAVVQTKNAMRTFEERESHVRVHLKPRIGGTRLNKLHALHIEGLYAEMMRDEIGPSAIRSAATTLSIALNYAVKMRLIGSNPAVAVAKPRVQAREMLCLDEVQARRLLAACGDSTASVLVVLALSSGCRQGELLALDWRDIDLAAGTVTIRKSLAWGKDGPVIKEPKTKASLRTVNLPPATVAKLALHRATQLKVGRISAPVFCTRTSGNVERKNVLRALRSIIKRANLGVDPAEQIPAKLRFHDLRHSMASLLLSRGRSLKAVSQRLGHANPAMTLRVYAHCMPTDDVKLAEELTQIFG